MVRTGEFFARPDPLSVSSKLLDEALDEVDPDYVVSLVSDGFDSSVCHAVALELGLQIDLTVFADTGCGISESRDFIEDYYGRGKIDLAIADAGDKYQEQVLKRGFYGLGPKAHMYAYHELKANPIRKVLSKHVRKGKRDVKILLINGARRGDSTRKRRQAVVREDRKTQNFRLNLIHHWNINERDDYIKTSGLKLSPVAKALGCSGECMCGVLQSSDLRRKASKLYPDWGNWMDELESIVAKKHGYGWGVRRPKESQKKLKHGFLTGCGVCSE